MGFQFQIEDYALIPKLRDIKDNFSKLELIFIAKLLVIIINGAEENIRT